MKRSASIRRAVGIVLNPATNTWNKPDSKTHQKPTFKRSLIAASLALAFTPLAYAAPSGGQVTSGTGNIAQSGATTTITQSSQNLSLNWNSFNVGSSETVNFLQPSSSAIAINRILGTNGTQILGNLNANGQVYLINPNGILFGQGAQVNVGGLVASTINIDDASVGNATQNFSGTGTGSIVNQGTINAADGGYVAMLGNTVSNQGTITANLGTVALGAGSAATLTFAGNSLVKMQIDQSTLNNLAENKSLIQADGGMVLMSAGAKDALLASVVNNSGVIEARTVENHNGTIILLGGMAAGTVNVGGTLDASATTTGNGGFIETSAAHIKIADNTKITTASTNGLAGTWLIDPVDFTIAATGGDITGSALGTLLGSNSVTIQTASGTNTATNLYGTTGTAGDINVNDTVAWSANTLTLHADNNININSTMNASGTAGLALEYGQANLNAGNTSTYNVNAPVNLASTGSFSTKLGSDGGVTSYTILTALGAAGSVTGTDLQGMNGNLAGNYVLGSNIDASGTSGWNACTTCNAGGAGNYGFAPVGDNSTGTNASRFTGIFNGLGHTISGLTINRPTTSYVGLFGYGYGSKISNVGLLGGSVSGGSYVGGLVGLNYGTVSNSYNTGVVIGVGTIPSPATFIGGLVGYNYSGTVSNSYATGNVSGVSTVGGLVGNNNGGGTVSNSYATGNVTGTGSGGYFGGLVGLNNSSSYGINTISNSYATGVVSGTSNVGGLVGNNYTGDTIDNSYATGAVSGTSNVGGLVGYNYGGTVTNSYAIGAITGTTNVGGLVGLNSGTVNSSYWNTTTSGQSTSAGGTGLNTVGMMTMSNFTGWDIANSGGSSAVWRIYEGSTTPLLRSFLTPITLTPVFDGTGQTLTNIGDYTSSIASPNTGNILLTGLTLNSTATPGSYTALLNVSSNQQGYDISTTASTITGSGSTANNLNIANATTWSAGKLILIAQNNININASLTALGSGSIALKYGQGAVASGNTNNYFLNNGAQIDLSAGQNFSTQRGSNGTTVSYTVITALGAQGDATVAPATMSLQGMNTNMSGNYVLGANIDASGTSSWNSSTGFTSIGSQANRYTGIFDGLGHTISNLAINAATDNVGLFGYTGTNALIQNVGLVGGSIVGNNNVGGLVGVNIGRIINAYDTGTVSGATSVGGLVGLNMGRVTGSHATGNVTGTGRSGGLAGYNNGGIIRTSYATGAVSGTYAVGGLVGNAKGGGISNSYATGSVTGTGNNVGGLVGYNTGGINYSYASGAVNGSGVNTGGLVGVNTGTGVIYYDYATSTVSGTTAVGGLVGYNFGGVIGNSYATGNVGGTDYVGGLAGNNGGGTIRTSYAVSSLTSAGVNVGGLLGANGGTVIYSYWNTDIYGTSAGGTGLTTAQMKQQSSFVNWNFASVWSINPGVSYPTLGF